jgi:hypothetical protein
MTLVWTSYLNNSVGKAATPGSILFPSKGHPFVELAAHDTPDTLFLLQIVVREKKNSDWRTRLKGD